MTIDISVGTAVQYKWEAFCVTGIVQFFYAVTGGKQSACGQPAEIHFLWEAGSPELAPENCYRLADNYGILVSMPYRS